MTYKKPEVKTLSAAISAIQHTAKMTGNVDNPFQTSTVNAYEADE